MEKSYCFKCLNTGHSIKECRSTKNCRCCRKSSHHTSLCKGPIQNAGPSDSGENTRKEQTTATKKQFFHKSKNKPETNVQVVSAATTQSPQDEPSYEVYPKWVFTNTQKNEKHVSLFTCKTLVRNPENGRQVEAVVFCDEGSQISVLGESLIESLSSIPSGRTKCCIGTY